MAIIPPAGPVMPPVKLSRMDQKVIAQALVDVLILRQETEKPDISASLQHAIIAASVPAFLTIEADRQHLADQLDDLARRAQEAAKGYEVPGSGAAAAAAAVSLLSRAGAYHKAAELVRGGLGGEGLEP